MHAMKRDKTENPIRNDRRDRADKIRQTDETRQARDNRH